MASKKSILSKDPNVVIRMKNRRGQLPSVVLVTVELSGTGQKYKEQTLAPMKIFHSLHIFVDMYYHE